MKTEGFIKAGIVALSAAVVGIIACGPELFFPVLLLAGIALCIRWLVASALSDWGFVDLTIKAFVVCFLIFVLGRPIFMIFEMVAGDDSCDRQVGGAISVALGMALAVYVFGVVLRIPGPTSRWRRTRTPAGQGSL